MQLIYLTLSLNLPMLKQLPLGKTENVTREQHKRCPISVAELCSSPFQLQAVAATASTWPGLESKATAQKNSLGQFA